LQIGSLIYLPVRNLYFHVEKQKASQIPYPKGGPLATVTEGFYKSYLSVRPFVLSAAKTLRAQNPFLPIVVNGHSLGGALSSMCAIDIAEQRTIFF
jgi:hypothetical protein